MALFGKENRDRNDRFESQEIRAAIEEPPRIEREGLDKEAVPAGRGRRGQCVSRQGQPGYRQAELRRNRPRRWSGRRRNRSAETR